MEQSICICSTSVKGDPARVCRREFQQNYLMLIFLQGLSFIIWLINSVPVVWYWMRKKKPHVDWRKPWRHWCKIGAFAKKITGETIPPSRRFGLFGKNSYKSTEASPKENNKCTHCNHETQLQGYIFVAGLSNQWMEVTWPTIVFTIRSLVSLKWTCEEDNRYWSSESRGVPHEALLQAVSGAWACSGTDRILKNHINNSTS